MSQLEARALVGLQSPRNRTDRPFLFRTCTGGRIGGGGLGPLAFETASKSLSLQGFSSLTVASSMVTVLPADDGK